MISHLKIGVENMQVLPLLMERHQSIPKASTSGLTYNL